MHGCSSPPVIAKKINNMQLKKNAYLKRCGMISLWEQSIWLKKFDQFNSLFNLLSHYSSVLFKEI